MVHGFHMLSFKLTGAPAATATFASLHFGPPSGPPRAPLLAAAPSSGYPIQFVSILRLSFLSWYDITAISPAGTSTASETSLLDADRQGARVLGLPPVWA